MVTATLCSPGKSSAEAMLVARSAACAPICGTPARTPMRQVEQIAASVRDFGSANLVLVDPEGTIIAGHRRLLGAKTLGLDEVPTLVVAHARTRRSRLGPKPPAALELSERVEFRIIGPVGSGAKLHDRVPLVPGIQCRIFGALRRSLSFS